MKDSFTVEDCWRLIKRSWGRNSGATPTIEHCVEATVILNYCASVYPVSDFFGAREMRESVEGRALAQALIALVETHSDRLRHLLEEGREVVEAGEDHSGLKTMLKSIELLEDELSELQKRKEMLLELDNYFDTVASWERVASMLLAAFRSAACAADLGSKKHYGLSKDGPAIRFIRYALKEITLQEYEEGRISTAVRRAEHRPSTKSDLTRLAAILERSKPLGNF